MVNVKFASFNTAKIASRWYELGEWFQFSNFEGLYLSSFVGFVGVIGVTGVTPDAAGVNPVDVGVDVLGGAVVGPGEDSLCEFSLLLKTPDMPGSRPRLDVDEVPRKDCKILENVFKL